MIIQSKIQVKISVLYWVSNEIQKGSCVALMPCMACDNNLGIGSRFAWVWIAKRYKRDVKEWGGEDKGLISLRLCEPCGIKAKKEIAL